MQSQEKAREVGGGNKDKIFKEIRLMGSGSWLYCGCGTSGTLSQPSVYKELAESRLVTVRQPGSCISFTTQQWGPGQLP